MLHLLKECLFINTIGCKINNNKSFIYLPLQLVKYYTITNK